MTTCVAPEPSGRIFHRPAFCGLPELYAIHFPSGVAVGFSALPPSCVTCLGPLPSTSAVHTSKLPPRFELQRSRFPSRVNAGSQFTCASVTRRRLPVAVETSHRFIPPPRFEEKATHSPSGE